ncbi:hypothetical protein [Streptomyces californicus]|uniref:hypothetical protein n=1 Tax=Streptomyces californicus TaxID=67351 RepID=UPI0004BFFB2B|nr:hypothetical protein [Streptomyces californicus]QRV58279.1 hypothetical protein I6J40_31735 [Streptomyces californicus]
MRAHDERSDDLRPGHRNGSRRPASATSPARTGLAALQHSIGNAAVGVALGREQAARDVTVQRALPPADERLGTYLETMGKGERSVSKAWRSAALTAFGRAIPRDLAEMDEQSADYTADSDSPQSKPPEAGGRFANLYGRDDDGSLAVMMENYRSREEKYTASEAFIRQWSRAVAMFNAGGFHKGALKVPTKPEDVPDRLPDSIFRQNVSGDAAKETLGALIPEGADTVTFQENDAIYQSVLKTVNGKSTMNIVRTFNQIKHLAGDQAFRISGGAIKRVQGNFQLRFDVTG